MPPSEATPSRCMLVRVAKLKQIAKCKELRQVCHCMQWQAVSCRSALPERLTRLCRGQVIRCCSCLRGPTLVRCSCPVRVAQQSRLVNTSRRPRCFRMHNVASDDLIYTRPLAVSPHQARFRDVSRNVYVYGVLNRQSVGLAGLRSTLPSTLEHYRLLCSASSYPVHPSSRRADRG